MAKCFESDFMKDLNSTERKILVDVLKNLESLGEKIMKDSRMDKTFKVSELKESFNLMKSEDLITVFISNIKKYYLEIGDINVAIYISLKCRNNEIGLEKFTQYISSLELAKTEESYNQIVTDYKNFLENEKARSHVGLGNSMSGKKDNQKSAIKAAQARLEYCLANKIIPRPEIVALARRSEEVEAKKAKKAARKARLQAASESTIITNVNKKSELNDEDEEAKFQENKVENKQEEIPDSWDN